MLAYDSFCSKSTELKKMFINDEVWGVDADGNNSSVTKNYLSKIGQPIYTVEEIIVICLCLII
jgi:hypothetical protein